MLHSTTKFRQPSTNALRQNMRGGRSEIGRVNWFESRHKRVEAARSNCGPLLHRLVGEPRRPEDHLGITGRTGAVRMKCGDTERQERAMIRNIGGLEFTRVGILRLKKDSAERVVEYSLRLAPGVKPNRYAGGPFCYVELVEASSASGICALTVSDSIKYIGEAENLARRFGPSGYGQIAARNLHSDGQSTNCRINSLVLQVSKSGEAVSVWFLPAGLERKTLEARLLAEFAPPWNGSRPRIGMNRIETTGSRVTGPPANRNRFESALRDALADASRSGKASLRVRSGDLHRAVGGYPGPSHQMPQPVVP
jgi:hypothetical protein